MENKPVITVRDRGLSISVFRRDKDGQATYGACFQRSWKDKATDEWKREQINFFPDELLKVAALCTRAYNDTIAYSQANRTASSGSTYPGQTIEDNHYPTSQSSTNVFDDDVPF